MKINLKGGFKMNKDIQPNYHEVQVECACGEKFTTKSTKRDDIIDQIEEIFNLQPELKWRIYLTILILPKRKW